MKKARGFTLVELMTVVGIIAILAAISYPIFTSQVRKSRRSEARQALSDLALRQEKYRSYNPSYASCDDAYSPTSCSDFNKYHMTYYTISVTLVEASKATTVVLTATAKGDQTKDSSCTPLKYTIDQGLVTKSPTDCW